MTLLSSFLNLNKLSPNLWRGVCDLERPPLVPPSWKNGTKNQFLKNISPPTSPRLKIVITKIIERKISYNFCTKHFSIRRIVHELQQSRNSTIRKIDTFFLEISYLLRTTVETNEKKRENKCRGKTLVSSRPVSIDIYERNDTLNCNLTFTTETSQACFRGFNQLFISSW